MIQRALFETEPGHAFDLPGYPAAWSSCKRYRYTLWRTWTDDPRPRYAMFCCLNPSTADETRDDPTVRRCIQFSKDWGFQAFVMTNRFAFSATDPRDMKAAADPIGPENDYWLKTVAAGAGIVVAAWGEHGAFMDRSTIIRGMGTTFPALHCLRLNASGEPMHPLYARKDLKPQRWL